MSTFIRKWFEAVGMGAVPLGPPRNPNAVRGAQADSFVQPEEPVGEPSLDEPESPALDLPPEGKGPEVPPAGADEKTEGTVIGNLGAKIVSTLVDWTQPEGGFLTRVKNPEVLDDGIDRLWKAIQEFNRQASRVSGRSVTETRELKELQSPWFFTAGARLQNMSSESKEDREKALTQLQLLAPKLEAKWNKFIENNDLGIRVTNPEVIEEPSGAPEEEEMAPEPKLEPELPDVMAGAPRGPGLGRPGQNLGAVPERPF